jgi:hypothetical protein
MHGNENSAMERAIWDLCQLGHARFLEEVAAGIGHVLEVVDELDVAAAKLLQTDDFYRPQHLENYPAKVLRNLAKEEAAKVLILLDVVRCPTSMKKERSRTLGYFYDHIAKGIYADVCGWQLGQFKELERCIEKLRAAYYPDPEGIFPNDIRYFREYDMYVNYVRDGNRSEARHHWTVPNRQVPVFDSTSLVVDVARALHEAGVTSQAGLTVVAEVWRPVEVRPEMGTDERQQMNRRTLDVLRERGLLAAAPGQVYERIEYEWPFPLWPRDLGERKVNPSSLRPAQQDPRGDW